MSSFGKCGRALVQSRMGNVAIIIVFSVTECALANDSLMAFSLPSPVAQLRRCLLFSEICHITEFFVGCQIEIIDTRHIGDRGWSGFGQIETRARSGHMPPGRIGEGHQAACLALVSRAPELLGPVFHRFLKADAIARLMRDIAKSRVCHSQHSICGANVSDPTAIGVPLAVVSSKTPVSSPTMSNTDCVLLQDQLRHRGQATHRDHSAAPCPDIRSRSRCGKCFGRR
jgi:hypothetical protein